MSSESLNTAGTPAACPACQTPLHGRYCHACGQDSLPDQRDIGFLVRDAFAEVFSLEGKTWHTIRDLVRRPARLLNAYRTGVGDYYFSPFKLFLVMSATLFLFLSWTDVAIYQFLPFRTADRIGVELIENGVKVTGIEYRDVFFQPYDPDPTLPSLEARLDAAAAEATESQRQAIAEYRAYNAAWLDMNAFWNDWIPRLLWVLMPAYAFLLIIFFPRRRVAEHMLFTIWAHCVGGVIFMAVAAVNIFGVGLPSSLIYPAFLGMFVIAAHGFYGVPRWQAALRGVGHLALYALLMLVVLMSFAAVYAWNRVNLEMWLGEGYMYVDGGAEVRVDPPPAEIVDKTAPPAAEGAGPAEAAPPETAPPEAGSAGAEGAPSD